MTATIRSTAVAALAAALGFSQVACDVRGRPVSSSASTDSEGTVEHTSWPLTKAGESTSSADDRAQGIATEASPPPPPSKPAARIEEVPGGPGKLATDRRTPELGADLSILKNAKLRMGEALNQFKDTYGCPIEAKYELAENGKLSLSVYPVKDVDLDAERNRFSELSGDPTVTPFVAKVEAFHVNDVEHLTRSARDLTLVQSAKTTLREAVLAVEAANPNGLVYWAVPTTRERSAGYGIYVLDASGRSRYFFVR